MPDDTLKLIPKGRYDVSVVSIARGEPISRVGQTPRWVVQYRIESGTYQSRVISQVYYGPELTMQLGEMYMAEIRPTSQTGVYHVLLLAFAQARYFDDEVRSELAMVSRQIELLRAEEVRLRQAALEQERARKHESVLKLLETQGFTPSQAMLVLTLVTGVCSHAIEAYDEGHIDDFDSATCLRHMLTRKVEPT